MNLMFKVKRREFVRCLVDLTNYAFCYGLLDEAESLIRCLRQLRPRLEQLDLFDGWLAVMRCDWQSAAVLSHAMVERGGCGPQALALLAYSRFALGDPKWRTTAHQVLKEDAAPNLKALMELLVGPLDPDGPEFFLNLSRMHADDGVQTYNTSECEITSNMVRA